MKKNRFIFCFIGLLILFSGCLKRQKKDDKSPYQEYNYLTTVKKDVAYMKIFQYPIRKGETSVNKEDMRYSYDISYNTSGVIDNLRMIDMKSASTMSISNYQNAEGFYEYSYSAPRIEEASYKIGPLKYNEHDKYRIKQYRRYKGESYLTSIGEGPCDTIYFDQIEKNCIHKLTIHHEGFKYMEYSCFDERGNLTEEEVYKGDYHEKKYYEYDENDLMIKRTTHIVDKQGRNIEEKTSTYTYKTDAKNNWTEQIEYDGDGNPIIFTQRQITYNRW